MKLQWPEHKIENYEEHTSCFDLLVIVRTLNSASPQKHNHNVQTATAVTDLEDKSTTVEPRYNEPRYK